MPVSGRAPVGPRSRCRLLLACPRSRTSISARIPAMVCDGPTNFDVVANVVQPAPLHEFVDEAASERFKSTASMPSMKPQRSAPAPTAMHTLCRLHACLSSVPWRRAVRCQPFAHRVSGRQLVFASGALSPGASYWEATGARFGDVAEVRSRRQASNSSPMSPVSPVAAAHGCRLCALRHLCARRGARRWRQLDAPRARRRHCRHGRRRRPLRRHSRPRQPLSGGVRDALLLLLCVCMRVTYMSSRGGSAVAPGGSGASTRWPTVTPGPAAAAGSTVVRSRSRLRWRLAAPGVFRDCARFLRM